VGGRTAQFLVAYFVEQLTGILRPIGGAFRMPRPSTTCHCGDLNTGDDKCSVRRSNLGSFNTSTSGSQRAYATTTTTILEQLGRLSEIYSVLFLFSCCVVNFKSV